MEDYLSLDVLALPVVHLEQLCHMVNETITSQQLLPTSTAVHLDCSRVVGFYVPLAVLTILLIILLSCYMFYYKYCVVAPPRVVCADQKREMLMKHCPVFFKEFCPTIWAPQAHMQTVIRVALQTFPQFERRRQSLTMSDGGHMCLDWYNEKSPHQPTVLLMPGITGSSDENYIRHWIDDMTALDYRTVVFNYRGCGYSKLSTPKLYCGGDIGDLEEVMTYISTTLPEAPLLAVGVSMASMMLMKYISVSKQKKRVCPLKAVLLISVVWELTSSDEILHRPLNKYTLNRHLCNNYKGIMKENRAVFEEYEKKGELSINYHRVMRCNSMRDMNAELVLPMFGYENMEQLYYDCSPCWRVPDINIPLLAINAADDPFCPPHTIPEDGVKNNPNLMLVTTQRGGHIGFMDGLLPFGKTLMDTALIQFAQAVFEHDIFSSQ